MTAKRIAILGGSGFVGSHLVAALARAGCEIRVSTRRRSRSRSLLVMPTCEVIETDVHRASNLDTYLAGCDAVVNLTGILNEHARPGDRFRDVHAELPGKLVEACRRHRIGRMLHMSALGVEADAPSEYLRTKFHGEEAAHAAEADGIAVTSFRPSVIFGPGDSFFNRFAGLLALSPFVFPLACPQARFAPVYVEDVVRAFLTALDDDATAGQRYELCGPRTYTLRELVAYTARVTGRRRLVVGLGDRLSRLQGQVLERVPGKPFSTDNYLSTKTDSVCSSNGFERLGIAPRSVESIVPGYLGASERNSRLGRLRASARRG
ncbi:MAG: complex I NDUFA9 subunit family protein [Thiotrichales bacterium]|nr:complex I NDUFA9 subunit family protein [Thiotrichales bacterium]